LQLDRDRRKGELSSAMIDVRRPYQLALPEEASLGAREHSFSDHGER